MKRSYFPDKAYNEIPCGLVAFKIGDDLEIVYANEKYYSGYADENSENLNIIDSDKDVIFKLKEKLEKDSTSEVYYTCNTGNGERRRVSMAVCRYDSELFLGALRDVTEQYDIIRRLRNDKMKYAEALCSSNSTVFEYSLIDDTSILYVPSAETNDIEVQHFFGFKDYMTNEMIYPNDLKFFFKHVYNDEEKILSARMKMPNDKEWKWYRIHRHFEYNKDGKLVRIFGTICNIEDEKRHENELKQKIEMDPVLKIYNRNAAVDRINKYLQDNPDRRDYALLVMDIDDFKSVNDTYGHLYGDAVIAMAADTLKEIAGNNGILGRYGGDEFFMFLKAADNETVCKTADEIVEKIKKVHITDGKYVTCSIGIALGSSFDYGPDYKSMFEKADSALYSVKNNGKSHWELYDEKEMSQNTGHAIDYESENNADDSELLNSRDMMKVFLELSAGAKTSDAAIYKIIRYVAEKFSIDWMQIMQVNCHEDLITIKYEWCNDVNFRNNAGRSGYYVHSDIMMFRTYFEKNPVFVICPENTSGFSMKFQREFEKNMRYAVLYNANITKDDSFYMFVCTRFDKENNWQENESEELNTATKIMTMYVSQADKETENERRFKAMIDYDKKTGLYTMQKFYEQIGRLRKFAAENDERVAIIHTDISNFLGFNRTFGIEKGDDLLIAFAKHINGNEKPERSISAHIDGTDVFLSAVRIKSDDRDFIKEIDGVNKRFCDIQNKKYDGANIIMKTGIYILKNNDISGDGMDLAIIAKRRVKDFSESFCALYEE